MSVVPTSETIVTETPLITGDELLAMGDIGPCELIDGRIVPMSPSGGEHGFIEFSTLGIELAQFVRQHKLGWVVGGEVGIYTRRNPDRVRGADIAFISRQRLPHKPGPGYIAVAPELVVEVVSPTDSWPEVRQKVKEYLSIGVERVWVVDPENREVLVYRSLKDSLTLSDEDTLLGEGKLEGFSLAVGRIFEE
jgi:Uma2 family endonuclease